MWAVDRLTIGYAVAESLDAQVLDRVLESIRPVTAEVWLRQTLNAKRLQSSLITAASENPIGFKLYDSELRSGPVFRVDLGEARGASNDGRQRVSGRIVAPNLASGVQSLDWSIQSVDLETRPFKVTTDVQPGGGASDAAVTGVSVVAGQQVLRGSCLTTFLSGVPMSTESAVCDFGLLKNPKDGIVAIGRSNTSRLTMVLVAITPAVQTVQTIQGPTMSNVSNASIRSMQGLRFAIVPILDRDTVRVRLFDANGKIVSSVDQVEATSREPLLDGLPLLIK